MPHDHCGSPETIYAPPTVVCPLCPLAGLVFLPNKQPLPSTAKAQSNNPCLSHLPKEPSGPSDWLLCRETSRPHMAKMCLALHQQSSFIRRTFLGSCVHRCVPTSLGEPKPTCGLHEHLLCLGTAIEHIKATNTFSFQFNDFIVSGFN